MQILTPFIKQSDLDYAIECLEVCKQHDAKEYGFNYPYFSPGGAYGKQWWQLDSSLALCGYKWVDRAFAEKALWNFIESQKEDGRICLWGADILPSVVAGGNKLMQTQGVSSLPKIFDVTYNILQGSSDKKLQSAAYIMLKNYLSWWFLKRQDVKTGLITAVFEETFIPYLGCSGEYAPIDTNVEVCGGCHYMQLLAEEMGKAEDAIYFEKKKKELIASINKYLWVEKKGAYYPYLVKEEKNKDILMASCFYPLRFGIANKEHRHRMINMLTDDKFFNWEHIPLTSVAKTDKEFTTTKGAYQGNQSWSGNVWSLINEMVIKGLIDCGEKELAANLIEKTIKAFNHNCAEFINPFDGSGQGVLQYAWTASQYIELIIENIFGVHYIEKEKCIKISPILTENLKKSYLELRNFKITDKITADIIIDNGKIKYSIFDNSINVIY